MDHTAKYRKWLPLLLFGVICVALLTLLFSYTDTGREKVYLTPKLHDVKGWEIYTLHDGERTDYPVPAELLEQAGTSGETVYLSRRLSPEFEAAGLTMLELASTDPAAVYLDGELLYTTCPLTARKLGQERFPEDYTGIPGKGEAVRLTLPAGYTGKELTIATVATKYSGTPKVVLTSREVDDGALISAVSRAAMPAAMFALAALLMLGLFLYGGFLGKWDVSLFLLLASALLQMCRYLQEYEFFSAFPYALSIPLSGLFQPLCTYLPMLFLLANMKKRRGLCVPFLLVPILTGFAPHLFALFGVDIGRWYGDLPFAIYPALLVLAVFSVLEYRDKNPVFRLFLPGFAAVLAAVPALYLGSLAGSSSISGQILQVFSFTKGLPMQLLDWCGILLFALCAGISLLLLIRRTAKAQGDLQAMTVKSELASESLRLMRENAEELATARHNMRHHLTAIAQYNRARKRTPPSPCC